MSEDWASPEERLRGQVYERRASDWRVGPVVYQVLVDRFAPAADLASKAALYQAPRALKPWSQTPSRGHFEPRHGVWSHELEFWGGDLPSLTARLDHIQSLGAEVLYLNPIQRALTNHKYDAQDYTQVSPEYGTRDDLRSLTEALDARGMRLVLDGVFNHMGRSSPAFQEALASPASPWRSWFYFGDEHPEGYRCWEGAPNLPEIRLESPQVKARIFGDEDSVVQEMLRSGVSGWRLDVAHDIGFKLLAELREAAHEARPDAWIIGEVWNYPASWLPSLDGVMNFHAREIILKTLLGPLDGHQAGILLAQMIDDAGIEGILRSWMVLDNHDTPRLATALGSARDRALARLLQFTLPGSPVIYYGAEVGMEGGEDPEMRAPMRWDLVNEGNETLNLHKRLLALRQDNPALRHGDFRRLDARGLLAFQRHTVRADETITVLVNPSGRAVEELISLRDSKAMNSTWLEDLWGGGRHQIYAGLLHTTIPAHSAMVLRIETRPHDSYSPYKRIQ